MAGTRNVVRVVPMLWDREKNGERWWVIACQERGDRDVSRSIVRSFAQGKKCGSQHPAGTLCIDRIPTNLSIAPPVCAPVGMAA